MEASDRSQRLQALFAAAVELPSDERNAYLERECADDPELRVQLRRLLGVDAKLQGTTVKPPAAGLDALIAQLAPPASLEGALIGPYRLCEPLGQGGMGSVYRAERVDGTVQQQVAVKFVRRELLDANTLRRFGLERQALASLDHPNIARLIDAAALDDGTPYFVMEYVAGVPITDYCENAQLGLRARLNLFGAVCAAVSHAHRNLIVHRDLKPGNILVSSEGVPKLLDFGIAKSLNAIAEAPAEQTGTAQRFFSPRYAAPEQLLGAAITVGCDVYALGLLLYELLCGRMPFDLEGLSAGQIERLVTSVAAPAPSMRHLPSGTRGFSARQLRGDLDGIVLRCLRKAAEERYTSVEQLEEDVRRYLKGLPVSARGGHHWYRIRKFIARHRWLFASATLAVSTVVLSMFALWRQNEVLKQERDLSRASLGIIKDAFIEADPIRASGTAISSAQILESARRRIDLVFDDQPELFATLAESIGEVDLTLGHAKEAAALLTRAVQAAERGSSADADRQRLLILLARALMINDQASLARQRLDEARTLSTLVPIEWRMAHGRWLSMNGAAKDGIAELLQCVAELDRVAPKPEVADSARHWLAEAYRLADDFPRSLEVLDSTLARQRATLAAEHPRIMRTRMRRVVALRDVGQKEESLKEALEIVDAIDTAYGPQTPEAAFAQNALGRSLDAVGRNQEALVAYRRAWEVWQRALGKDHPNTLRAMFNLAYTLQLDAGKHAEAEALYRDLLALTSHRLGAQNELTVYFRLYAGRFLLKEKKYEQAFALLVMPGGRDGLIASAQDNREYYLETVRELLQHLTCDQKADERMAPRETCALAKSWLSDADLQPAKRTED